MKKETQIRQPGYPNFLLLTVAGGVLFLFFCVLTLAAHPARAANTVGTGTPASCTQASLDTALTGGGIINFDCGASPYSFPITSLKVISVNTTLDGTGPGITFDANKGGNQFSGGIFQLNSGTTFTLENVSLINGMAASNGAAINAPNDSSLIISNVVFNNNISTVANSYEGGGAIFLGTNVSAQIDGSTFSYNKAPSGGAINSRDSVSLVISGTTFLGNEATNPSSSSNPGSDGGAIYSHSVSGSQPPMTFHLEASKVYSNVARTQGGGISVSYKNATQSADVKNVEFAYNKAGIDTGNGRGGAIYVEQGQLSVSGAAIYKNAVPNYGGGIFIGRDNTVNPYVTIQNSSIGDNQAYDKDNSHGGGISHTSGTLLLTAVTIANNYSQESGGGIFTGSTNAPTPASGITLANSIVAGNNAAKDSFFPDCSDVVSDGGHNLQSNQTSQNCTNTVLKIDPLITGISYLGGPTPSYGLKAGSPALNVIPAASCAVSQDQRGFSRPYGNLCDIGAFEGVVQPPSLGLYFSPSTIPSGGTTTLTFGVVNTSSPGTALSNIAFKDDLPANLKVAATPNITTNCAGPYGNPNVIITNSSGTINVNNLNLNPGQICAVSVDVTNSPASTNPITTTVGVVSYLDDENLNANAHATLTIAGADAIVVTNPNETGSGVTLQDALSQVETTNSKTILFKLDGGNTITVTNQTTLTVGQDVKFIGKCDYPNGSGITITGARFILGGNVTFSGIKLIGPASNADGPILSNTHGSTPATYNHLSCVTVRTAP